MNMKKGDKLYCINKNIFPFIVGLEYTVLDITQPFDFGIVYFEEHSDYMIGAMYIDEFFATEKRYRKLKLEKLNQKNYERR